MIERYTLTVPPNKLAERFAIQLPESHTPRYNAGPAQLLPVITSTAPQGISIFYWGTSPEWAKNKALSERIINARVETIREKPNMQKTLMKSRCIIPADSFYAWRKAGKKTQIPYRFVTTNQDIFSFAGLWEEFEDTDGNSFHTFAIITVPANPIVASVHDRMPAILSKQTEALWLNPNASADDLINTLEAYPENKMNLYTISPRISDLRIDVPSLISPAPASDQFGNLTLFD